MGVKTKKSPDFSGYASKAGLVCADGRVIMRDAFAHMDGKKVPLMWQHGHNTPENVLGHAILEARDGHLYSHAFFNDSPAAQHAKVLVESGDIDSLSIWANKLTEKSMDKVKQVFHGFVREVSLVLSGANEGAKIDFVAIQHSDDPNDVTLMDDTAVIFTGESLFHSADVEVEDEDEETDEDENLEHAEGDDETVQEVYDSMSDKQKDVLHYMIGAALEAQAENQGSASHSADQSDDEGSEDDDTNTEGDLTHQEGSDTMNVFDQNDTDGATKVKPLNDEQIKSLLHDAMELGSFKAAALKHAANYGVNEIEMLFPEAKELNNQELHSRRMEWVSSVLDQAKKIPFAKVRSTLFDITAEEARARGYVKGNKKVDEVIQLLRRSTGPTTIYKKQRLDRDDVIDITDMDIVNFLKAEMKLMLEEELARAILVGDGRPVNSTDKVKDPAGDKNGDGIRSIYLDDEFYAPKHQLAANVAPKDAVKGMVRARAKYRGTGKPTLFVSDNFLTEIMLEEDKFGRPLYATEAVLADKLRVKEIVTVDLFDEHPNLLAIMVNMADYSIGTNKGGQLTSFEDFDIDYNQYKYLQETRLSGGLTKYAAAVVITREQGTSVTPTAPSFDGATNTISVPTVTGVVYQVDEEAVTGNVVITKDTEVVAVADEGYFIPAGATRDWNYTYTA